MRTIENILHYVGVVLALNDRAITQFPYRTGILKQCAKLRDEWCVMKNPSGFISCVIPRLLAVGTSSQILVLAHVAAAQSDTTIVCTSLESRENAKPAPGNKFTWNAQVFAYPKSEVIVCLPGEMCTQPCSQKSECIFVLSRQYGII